tara:strand:- start:232 stop:597 length:366 start_codon:yes stop_codon:yes gene_type:complete
MGLLMPGDEQFIYSLEVKILDLEKTVGKLTERLDSLETRLAAGEPHLSTDIPEEIIQRIENGESALRVLREHRLLTQKELSERCGIRPNHISAMERGTPFGLKTAKRLAEALDVPVGLVTR